MGANLKKTQNQTNKGDEEDKGEKKMGQGLAQHFW